MATDQAPATPRRRTPETHRPSSDVAWAAAWRALGSGEVARGDLICEMQDASPITYRTAREILTQAVTDGLLEVASRDRYGRPTLKRPT